MYNLVNIYINYYLRHISKMGALSTQCYIYNSYVYKMFVFQISAKSKNFTKKLWERIDSPSVSPFGLFALTAAAKQRGQDDVKSALLWSGTPFLMTLARLLLLQFVRFLAADTQIFLNFQLCFVLFLWWIHFNIRNIIIIIIIKGKRNFFSSILLEMFFEKR